MAEEVATLLYLLAAIGALTVAFLLWRAFGPQRLELAPRRPVIAPDDDPEFLRSLGERKPKPEEGKGT